MPRKGKGPKTRRPWIILLICRHKAGAPIRAVPKPYLQQRTTFSRHRTATFPTKKAAVGRLREIGRDPRFRYLLSRGEPWRSWGPHAAEVQLELFGGGHGDTENGGMSDGPQA